MGPRPCPRGCVGACELAKRSTIGPGETMFTARPNDPLNPDPAKCWIMVDRRTLASPAWIEVLAEVQAKRDAEEQK